MKYLKKEGCLYIAGVFNENPIDVVTRYRYAGQAKIADWQLGWNLFSTKTYDAILQQIGSLQWQWHDLKCLMRLAGQKIG